MNFKTSTHAAAATVEALDWTASTQRAVTQRCDTALIRQESDRVEEYCEGRNQIPYGVDERPWRNGI